MKQIEALKCGKSDRGTDSILACRLGFCVPVGHVQNRPKRSVDRRWAVATGDQRPTARKTPSFRAFLHTRKEQERRLPLLFFLCDHCNSVVMRHLISKKGRILAILKLRHTIHCKNVVKSNFAHSNHKPGRLLFHRNRFVSNNAPIEKA